jgi:exopolysaccharide production protein ExoY
MQKYTKSHGPGLNSPHDPSRAQPEVSKLDLPNGFHRTLYRKVGKRALDVLLVLASLPITLPLILLLMFIMLRYNKMPLFGHRRVGKNGRKFYCWKIRTMVPDAEERLRLHLENDSKARNEWETNFKLENDPRITHCGKFLRSSSLDELPQLWNILTGDMSVVGPRPVTEAELDLYKSYATFYTMVRPGLTGLWQVSGRNCTSYQERTQLDVDYVRDCSLAIDISIVMRTVKVVLGRTGI